MNTSYVQGREIVQTRLINAKRERVYNAFTDPENIGTWWGPDGFTITTHEMDVRVGGKWRFIMHGPDGTDYNDIIIYTLIDPPKELRFTHGDDSGGEMSNSFETIITFEEQGEKTLLTMRAILASEEVLRKVVEEHNAIEGGKQTINRLEQYLLENGN